MCGIQLLFYELHCFTHFGSLVGLIVGVVLKHFRIFTADLQIRNIPVVHTQDQFAVHRLDQEIRNDLAHGCFHRTTPAAARFRIEGDYFVNSLFQRAFADVEAAHDLVVVLAGKFLEIFREDMDSHLYSGRRLFTVELEQ